MNTLNTNIITIKRDDKLVVSAMALQYFTKYTSLYLGRFVEYFDAKSGASDPC